MVIRSMQSSNKIALFLLGFAALSVMSCSVIDEKERAGSGSSRMQVSLYKGSSTDKLRMELENISDEYLLVLMWNMPSSSGELESDVFEVAECSGTVLPYKGMLVSRVGVGLRDVLHLGPGEKVTRSINLADFYDLKKSACYTVRYNSCLQYRKFKSAEQVREFLKKSENALTVEQLSLVGCMESNVLKFL